MIEKLTYFTMDFRHFDELATEFLGRPYEFVAEQEANNGCAYIYRISSAEANETLSKYNEARTDPRAVLLMMIRAGLLQEGRYLITVNW